MYNHNMTEGPFQYFDATLASDLRRNHIDPAEVDAELLVLDSDDPNPGKVALEIRHIVTAMDQRLPPAANTPPLLVNYCKQRIINALEEGKRPPAQPDSAEGLLLAGEGASWWAL